MRSRVQVLETASCRNARKGCVQKTESGRTLPRTQCNRELRAPGCPLLVAQEINSEAKFQNDFLNQLQMTLAKAQAGVKNNMRRMNKSIIQQGSNHVLHVVLFALFCFFVVYLLSKFSRR